MKVDDKTLKDLEWSTILKHLAAHASSELGKELCLNLLPDSDVEDVRHALKLTTEAKGMLQMAIIPPLGGIFNIVSLLKKAEIGVVLENKDFIDIRSTLVTSRNLKSFFLKQEEKYPTVSQEASYIMDHNSLIGAIDRCFDPSGNILDTASAQLKQLRDSLRSQTNSLKEKINALLHSDSVSKFLQEPVYTIRNDRYVLPVKAENKSNVPGIVHDSSASGATIFIEPRAIVDLNNKLKETELKIDHEILRILSELTMHIAHESERINITLIYLARLDFIFAKARYSQEIDAGEPEINLKKEINLKLARHPILIKTIKNVVANTINIGEKYSTLVITGSNTGGKTVLLKTVGICVLMAGAGLHIPVETDSSLYLFSSVYADIGDEQSIEQSLSTFSAHMLNVINIVDNCNDDSLVLLDEIGGGTDPAEGAALAQALMEYLHNKGANTVVTTHYGSLKTLAFSHKGFYNASVEFDVETLTPTYRLLMGIPGKSNATTIAHSLGLNEEVVFRTKEIYSESVDDFSLMLEEFQQMQREIAKELEMAKTKHKDAEAIKEQYNESMEKFNSTRVDALNVFKRKLFSDLNKAKSEVIGILSQLKEERTEKTAKRAHSKLAELGHNSHAKIDRYKEGFKKAEKKQQALDWQKINVGDKVFFRKLGQIATLMTLPDDKQRVVIQMGLIKSTVNTKDLFVAEKTNDPEFKPRFGVKGSVTKTARDRSLSTTCDLRGKTVDEGLQELEVYLDRVALAGIAHVYIVHGHGTGLLRKAVRKYLDESGYVESYRPGEDGEGGDGVSVVKLK